MTLEQTLIARMSSGEPFTYDELCHLVMNTRLAGRIIQHWHVCGWIEYELRGHVQLWSLTTKGRAATSEWRV